MNGEKVRIFKPFLRKKSEFWEKKSEFGLFHTNILYGLYFFRQITNFLDDLKQIAENNSIQLLHLTRHYVWMLLTDIIITAYFYLNYALQRIPYPAVCELVCWSLVPDCTCDQRPSICLLGKWNIKPMWSYQV